MRGHGVSIGGSGKGRYSGAARLQRQMLIGLQPHLCTYVAIVSGTVMVGIMNGASLVGGSEAVCVGIWPCVFVLFGVLDGAPVVGSDAICVGVWPCGFSSLMCLPRKRDAPVSRIGSERFDWMVKSLELTKGK